MACSRRLLGLEYSYLVLTIAFQVEAGTTRCPVLGGMVVISYHADGLVYRGYEWHYYTNNLDKYTVVGVVVAVDEVS